MAAARVASRELTERFWTRSPSGFGTSMDPYLLVGWACRDREEHHCSDGRGEDFFGWTARGLLLLAKLRGPQQPQVHISHHRCPARTQVHQVSFDPCFVGAVGSSNYPRVTVRSYGQIDRWTPMRSAVIVIDLDECKDEKPASAILLVLGQFVSKTPKVKFFLTGRPEPQIRINSDIRLFFRYQFSGLKGRRRGINDWPTEQQLDPLCERTGGLFVYAVATIHINIPQFQSHCRRMDHRRVYGSESLRRVYREVSHKHHDRYVHTVVHSGRSRSLVS